LDEANNNTRFAMTRWAMAALTAGLWTTAACASAPVNPADLQVDCDRLEGDTPAEAGAIFVEFDRDVQNRVLVQQRINDLYRGGRRSEVAVLQVMVRPDGTVERGCVRRPSGDREFDRIALQGMGLALFNSDFLEAGESVWLLLRVSGR